ncbi:hypothetical protein AMTRI_Chr04g183950 [Amborella trichopoda]
MSDSSTGVRRKFGEKRKKEDEVAGSFLITQCSEDQMRQNCTVLVSNLSMKLKTKAIIKEFSKFGEIESISISKVKPILNETLLGTLAVSA